MIGCDSFTGFRGRAVWRDLALVLFAALIARAGFGWVRFQRSADPASLEFPDEQQYWYIAGSLAQGKGQCDEMGFRATRMPLYPGFLSLFSGQNKGPQLAKASQWLIGALAAPLIAAVGIRIAGRRLGLLAGFIVAFDPFLIFFSSLLLTETITITALCGFWLCLAGALDSTTGNSIWKWLGVGVIAAICVYLRESNLGLVIITILLAVTALGWNKSALIGGGTAMICIFASLVPWAARNHAVIGEWCWLTTRGGISLYDGVGPQATGASDLGLVQRAGAAADLSETQWNQYFQREAWSAIRRDPVRIIRLAGTKFLRMWNPLPNVETYRSGYARWVSAVWAIPLFILALVGAGRCILFHGRKGLVTVTFLLLPALYFSLLHSLYIGSVRYRLPAVPMLALLAAMAFLPRSRRNIEA